MSSLFTRLIHLATSSEKTPFEDFFTEIFAYVIENDKQIQGIFLEYLANQGILLVNQGVFSEVKVYTQRTYPALPGHNCDSRPDIEIRFKIDNQYYLIFLENKIDSQEGSEQLKRYAEHLKELQKTGCRTGLVYITKYYDPKDEIEISQNHLIPFFQRRWYEIYNLLKQVPSTEQVTKEIINFMKEHGMDLRSYFTKEDNDALINFNKARTLMDECMGGKVAEYFTKTIGVRTKPSVSMTQIREQNRYIYVAEFENTNCGLGFQFTNTTDEGFMDAVVFLELKPQNQRELYLNLLTAFKGTHQSWIIETQKGDYPRTVTKLPYQQFKAGDEGVASIQDWFIQRIAELADLKKHPDLFR